MIQISIGNDAITIDGHSEDAPHGQSVPCEAVTVLVNTYIASLADYKEPKYELWSGHFAIKLDLIKYLEGTILTRAFKTGLEMLAQAYPEYISMI